MKRSQDAMAPSQLPHHKKLKVAPQHPLPQDGAPDPSEDEWTRVEKRKAKKTKKVEAKHNVCLVPIFLNVI